MHPETARVPSMPAPARTSALRISIFFFQRLSFSPNAWNFIFLFSTHPEMTFPGLSRIAVISHQKP